MLFPTNLHEDLIDIESIAITLVFPLQASGIFGSELDTPEPDCFITDSNSTLGEEIFDISIAEIEPVVQPDCVTDDIWWESVAFVGVHRLILPNSGDLTCQYSPEC